MKFAYVLTVAMLVDVCNFKKGIEFKQLINHGLKRRFYLNINAYLLENVAINV